MARDVWDVLDWDTVGALAKEESLTGKWALTVISSADPSAEFVRLAKAYLRGFTGPRQELRLRVTAMAAAFGADRDEFAQFLRSNFVIGPKD